MSDFSDWLVDQTAKFDEKILQSFKAGDFFGKWDFVKKRGKREPDPLRVAIRKARREQRKLLKNKPA